MGMGSQPKPHTPVIASDSARSVATVYVLHGLCEGPIKGFAKPDPEMCIKLNGTALKNPDGTRNFEGVAWAFRDGSPFQDPIDGFFGASREASSELGLPVELKYGAPRTVTIQDADADEISMRFAVNGMYEQKDNGDVTGSSVSLKVEIRDGGDGSQWVDVSAMGGFPRTKTGKFSSKYEWSGRASLAHAGPKAPWQVRVSRLTADSASQTLVNATWLEGISVIKNKKMVYPGVALCAVRADASQFNSVPAMSFHVKGMIIRVPSNYDPDARTYSGSWDGTFKLAYSNNPAWCFYDILIEDRYGLGDWVKPIYVDKWGLYEIGRYCDEMVPDGKGGMEPRFTLNCYIQNQEEAVRVIQAIASSFHAMTYWASGAVFAAQDAPRDPAYLFAPANVRDGAFSYSSTARRARHNAIVSQWNNPESGYRLEPELVEMPDKIRELGFRFPGDRVAYGCTSRGQAQRDAKWALFTANHQTEVVSFGVGLEGCQLRPGDIIAIADPLRDGGIASGRIRAVSGATIALDREADLPGGPLSLILTSGDGRVCEGQFSAPRGPASSVVVPNLAFAPEEGSVWTIASRDIAPELWRVISIAMDGEGGHSVSALLYDPQKFGWIEQGLDLRDRRPWVGASALPQGLRPPQGLVLTEYLYKDKEDLKTGVMAQWVSALDAPRFLPAYRLDNGNWADLPMTNQHSADMRPIEPPCELWFQVRAQTLDGEITPPAEAQMTVLGKRKPPLDVTGFRVRCDDSANLIFDWDANEELDFSCYEIREGGSDWDSAPLLVTDLAANKFTCDIGKTRSTKFWTKARDTSGTWSQSAAMATLQIYDPLDGDVLSVARKRELALQWDIILQEQVRLDALAKTYGISSAAYDSAIIAVQSFFSARQEPFAWRDFNGPTYLGIGGGAELSRLLKTIKDEQIKLAANIAVGNMAAQIASGATDAMLKSGFLDANGKVRWDKLQVAYHTIFANQLYMANWDNLIPNPNSEIAAPSGGWAGNILGAGVVSGNAYAGSFCRTAAANTVVYVTDEIPCGRGDQFTFRAMVKGIGARLGIYFKVNGTWQAAAAAAYQSASSVYPSDADYDRAPQECHNTDGAPAGTSAVRFGIAAGAGAAGYFDELYARRMNDALLLVDGAVKAQHLEAVLAILGSLQSPNYKAGTYSEEPQGFKISGPPFDAKLLGGKAPVTVQAEFGGEISIGGKKAAKLADLDNLCGIHLTGFRMDLYNFSTSHPSPGGITISVPGAIAGLFDFSQCYDLSGLSERFIWPKESFAGEFFDVLPIGVQVKRAGIYEIDACCPFSFGSGEAGWSWANRTELLRRRPYQVVDSDATNYTLEVPDEADPSKPPALRTFPISALAIPIASSATAAFDGRTYDRPDFWEWKQGGAIGQNAAAPIQYFSTVRPNGQAASLIRIVFATVLARSFFPERLDRGGGSTPSMAHTGTAGPLKAIARLQAGDVIAMRGYGPNASYTNLYHANSNHAFTNALRSYRASASYLTIKLLVPLKYAPATSAPGYVANAPTAPT
jgi:predicted phage tail protein